MKITLPLSLACAAALCFIPSGFAAAKDTIKAEIVRSRPLVEGRKTPVVIHLQHVGGLPLMAEELETVHEHPLHLLIIDPSLSDYHHEHPNAMNMPGDYIFTMTPHTACSYRVWADIDTVNADQQFISADLPGAEKCVNKSIDHTISTSFDSNGYRFQLIYDAEGLQIGQDATLKLSVRTTKGAYVDELEPIMGSFAHMVGFYDDYKTVAHIHPMGDEPADYNDRGGPSLEFHINPAREGFLKLFAQVKIDGNVLTIPFGIEVKGEPVDPLAVMEAAPIPADAIPIGTPSPEPAHAKQSDEIDKIMKQETESLAAEKKEKEEDPLKSGSLQDLYKAHNEDTGNGSLYDNEEERLLKNKPKIENGPLPGDGELPEDWSDEPLQ